MERNSKWYQLDNAAKIIPSTARGGNTRVFRITCELKEEVDPQILQNALDQTIIDFPHFNCVLRKGLFWYYLDARNLQAKVMQIIFRPAVRFILREERIYYIVSIISANGSIWKCSMYWQTVREHLSFSEY